MIKTLDIRISFLNHLDHRLQLLIIISPEKTAIKRRRKSLVFQIYIDLASLRKVLYQHDTCTHPVPTCQKEPF